MFKKILIANRGEIACRVIKTARRMGIATVAVYSEADRDALHVELADEAVCIGPPAARESYLVMTRSSPPARQTGAEAVHPGYGFLSENEAFCAAGGGGHRLHRAEARRSRDGRQDRVEEAGEAAGSTRFPATTTRSKDPGAAVEDRARHRLSGDDQGVRRRRRQGPARRVHDDRGARRLRVLPQRGEERFGDDRVFIEKFVEEPRHIEIQVLGDAHGNTVYLWERECSIQRRHQKVIEEAPSPFLDDATRRAMGEQAVALARAVKYQSAGTVEFVVGRDKQLLLPRDEHPAAGRAPGHRMITGLDLVELMIRVAAGEKLPFTQERHEADGWAMECRINAEDPFRGFLPSVGRLVRYRRRREEAAACASTPASTKAARSRCTTTR
jgi:propionyl-CoA carboxylase alpha chain